MNNRLEDARNDYEKLVELITTENQLKLKASALLRLGRICMQLNNPAKAKTYLQNALEIDVKINVFNSDERSEIAKILQSS